MSVSAWTPILPADFVDPLNTPNTDPNGIFTSLVHVGAGRYQATYGPSAVNTLPMNQMMTWRLNPPAGFDGSGYYHISIRWTPQALAQYQFAGAVIGHCDRDGDPTNVNARVSGGGFVSTNPPANGFFSLACTRTAGSSFSSSTPWANGPRYFSYLMPWGPVGLPTTVGARGGVNIPPLVWYAWARGQAAVAPNGWETGDSVVDTGITLTDGTYQILGIGASNGGAGVEVLDFTMEWCVHEHWPAGTFGADYDAP